MENMKIVKLTAENYKRLKAVEITPEGNTVILSGKNGAGKSSVLDAIWSALSGGEAGKKNKQPIRKGEKTATVTLDLGDLVVTRKWTSDTQSYLTVENADGMTYKSPQGILDALVGRLTFDPLAFAGLKAKEQVAALLEVVDLDIDLEVLDEGRKKSYDERTEVNREIFRLENVLKDKNKPEVEQNAIEVNLAETMMELNKAKDIKREKDERQIELANAETLRIEKLSAIDHAKKELAAHDEDIKNLRKKFEDIEETLCAGPDIGALQEKLAGAENTNLLVRRAKEYRELTAELKGQREIAELHTADIESTDRVKAEAIKKAKMPVEGLSFDEDGLTLNGVPFVQASSAEQLKVSTAMAMAVNPKLRVIRITDGSLLDKDSMKIIEKMAKDKDYQIWIEVVSDSGKVGVYIEDGEVK